MTCRELADLLLDFVAEELADVFQLEKNNVAVRLHRIRLRLQAEMQR